MNTRSLLLFALVASLALAAPSASLGADSPTASATKAPAAATAETPAPPADLKAPARATAENAAAFLGEWTLNLEGPNGPSVMSLALKNNAGRISGEISAATPPGQTISDFTRRATSLELRYTFELDGTHVEGVVTLTPDQGKMAASVSYAEGAFVMEGTATKKAK
jgi:hypothetical protein